MPAAVAQRRHFGFDLLRVFATYMVMQIHTGEFEYIGSNGVIHSDGAWAVGWINSLFRSSVPLFVMISATSCSRSAMSASFSGSALPGC